MKSFEILLGTLLLCTAVQGDELHRKESNGSKADALLIQATERALKSSKSDASSDSKSRKSKSSMSKSSSSKSKSSSSKSKSSSSKSKSSKSKSKSSSSKSRSSDNDKRDTVAVAVAENDRLDTLESLLALTGLDETLDDYKEGPFTIFAPTDAAFNALDSSVTERLLDPEFLFHLTDVLLFHAVYGEELGSDMIEEGAIMEMANEDENLVKVNDAQSVYLRPYPLFDLQQARIVRVDDFRSNGVVHQIARVLQPMWIFQNLYDTIEMSGYSTLASLLTLAGLEDAVKDTDTKLTILAPTDSAFEELDDDLVDCLVANPDVLAEILLYHAVPAVADSMSLDGSNTLDTLQGSTVTTEMTKYGLTVNEDTHVVEADLLAFNGIVHGIDSVLVYEGFSCP